jgi:hypothetical protein
MSGSAVSVEILNLILSGVGIIASIIVAILGAILFEIRSARQKMEKYGRQIGIIQTVVSLLPCKTGQCSMENRDEGMDEGN